MFAENTKCVIKSAPDMYSHLVGQGVVASTLEGARGTGTQQFKLTTGGCIFGNGDSGFVVEEKK